MSVALTTRTASRSAPTLLSLLVLALAGTAAHAQTVVTVAPAAGPAALGTGNGLNGQYFKSAGTPAVTGSSDITSDSTANPNGVRAFTNANAPQMTFTALTIAYPNTSDGTALFSYLGLPSAAATTGGPFVANESTNAFNNNTLDTTIYRYTGFLNVTTDLDTNAGLAGIQLSLSTTSDDGSSVFAGLDNGAPLNGSQLLINNGGNHGPQTVTTALTFNAAGLYPITVYYDENGTGTTMSLQWLVGAGAGLTNVPQSRLFTTAISTTGAPEPGSLALIAPLLLGAGGWAIRRHRRPA